MHGQYCFLDREFLLKHVRQSIAANILPPSISKSRLHDYPMERERERAKTTLRLDMPLAIPAQIRALLCGTLGLSILGFANHQQVGKFNTMKSDTSCMVEMVASCLTKLQLDLACFQVTVLRIDKLLRFACVKNQRVNKRARTSTMMI